MYYKRFIDTMLLERLQGEGAVLIRGPKGCGKTKSALRVAKSSVFMDTDVTVPFAMEIDPKRLLVGNTPRLIDKWQEYPLMWNYVKR
jgi:MoxR-like ATPase